MKFEKITNKKIKIVLSLSELKSNNIDINNIFSNSKIYQTLLQMLLKMAEQKIGFKTEDYDLLVETTCSCDKNYVIFITKLDSKYLFIENYLNSLIFEFNKFEDFNDLCYFLKNMTNINFDYFTNNFSLFLHNNTYFLHFKDVNTNPSVFNYIKNIISEFGKNVSNYFYFSNILNEHGKKILDSNAFLTYINKL